MNLNLIPRISLLALTITLFSCSVSKKVDKWVGKHYGQTVPAKIKSDDHITFSVRDAVGKDKVSITTKTSSKMIPAFFYWEWKQENSATLNVMLPVNSFVNGFLAEAKAKKLDGGKLNIVLASNPGDFRLQDRGWMVYFIVGYVSQSKVYVEPSNYTYSIEYSYVSAGGQTKTGTVSITNPNKERVPRLFQSLKGAVGEYLTMSDAHVSSMAKELADKLILELAADGMISSNAEGR